MFEVGVTRGDWSGLRGRQCRSFALLRMTGVVSWVMRLGLGVAREGVLEVRVLHSPQFCTDWRL